MRSSSFLILVVFLVLGTLAAQAAVAGVPPKGQGTDKGHALVKGRDPVRGQDPVKGQDSVKAQSLRKVAIVAKPGLCPKILIRCAMLNPPNRCLRDTECPGAKKCCVGSCGRVCMDPK
ncbi:elafin [Equus quagga]|uniref:elafin n=1 Tax=Equus quagga TaxID=89248 RepID=UPI001EE31124|nr:elafin [Equus quagga]